MCVFCGKEIPEGQRQCTECYGDTFDSSTFIQLVDWYTVRIAAAYGIPTGYLAGVTYGTLARSYEGERSGIGDQNAGPSLLEKASQIQNMPAATIEAHCTQSSYEASDDNLVPGTESREDCSQVYAGSEEDT